MRINHHIPIHTAEGAPAKRINAEQQLRRSVLSCLLWEKEFYEDGEAIADRITQTAALCSIDTVAKLAIEARNTFGLRHAPLMLLLDLIRRGGPGVAEAVATTIRRADEMAELVSLYWRDGKRPLSKQMKVGLAAAFGGFNEYQLAKYNRDAPVKLRDVMFLCHPKPKDESQKALFKRVANNELVTPDTWEVTLSGGADKRETFERLLREGKLGYLALLRNLRNMATAGCDVGLVCEAILARKGAELVFPFRYVAAARAAPGFATVLDQALRDSITSAPTLKGRTIVLVDVSGSMRHPLSGKSDLNRMDAAATLASVINAEYLHVFTFSDRLVQVLPYRGLAGIDQVVKSQPHSGTDLGSAVHAINQFEHDRLIVITDEQSQSYVPNSLVKRSYMINVASNKNGVGYGGNWIHIDGFSEAVIRYILEIEAQ